MVKNHARSVFVREAGGKYSGTLRQSAYGRTPVYEQFAMPDVLKSRDLMFEGALWRSDDVVRVGWMKYVLVEMELTAGVLFAGSRVPDLIDPAFRVSFPVEHTGSDDGQLIHPSDYEFRAILRSIWCEPFVAHSAPENGRDYAFSRVFHLGLDRQGRSRSGRQVLTEAGCATLRRRVDTALIELSELAADLWWEKASRRVVLRTDSKQSIPPDGRDAKDVNIGVDHDVFEPQFSKGRDPSSK